MKTNAINDGRRLILISSLLIILLVLSTTLVSAQLPADITAALDQIRARVGEVACIVLRFIQLIVGLLAVLIIMFSGIQWATSEDPAKRQDARDRIIHVIFGALIVLLAIHIVNVLIAALIAGSPVLDAILDPVSCAPTYPGLDDVVNAVRSLLCVVIRTAQGLAGIIGGIAIIYAGIKWISSEDPDTRNSAKSLIQNAIIGILVVIIAGQALGTLFVGVDPTKWDCAGVAQPEPAEYEKLFTPLQTTICLILRLLQAVAGVIGVLIITYWGIRWLTSEDPEVRVDARRNIITTIIGLLVILVVAQGAISDFFDAGVVSFDCPIPIGDIKAVSDIINFTICKAIYALRGIAGILASLVIVLAGIKWMSSEDPDSRNQAKNMIVTTIIGLLIIFLVTEALGQMFTGGQLTFECEERGVPPFVTTTVKDVLCYVFRILQAASVMIATLVLLVSGIMFTASEDPDRRAGAKQNAMYAIIGVLIVFLATQFVTVIISGMDPTFTGCESRLPGINDQMLGAFCVLKNIIEALAGILAAIVLAYSGLKWISSDDPSVRAEAKKSAIYAITGMIFVLVSMQLINAVITGGGFSAAFAFSCEGKPKPTAVTTPMVNALCVILRVMEAIAGVLAVLVIALSGVKWASSEDVEVRNEAKKTIIQAIVGLLIVIIALQLINAVLTGAGFGTVDCPDPPTGADYRECIDIYLATGGFPEGPLVAAIAVTPTWITPGEEEDIIIMATITDSDGVASATANINPSIPMTGPGGDGNGVWTGTLPEAEVKTLAAGVHTVEIVAVDGKGWSSTHSAGSFTIGAPSTCTYTDGTTAPFSDCTNNDDCIGDWTCIGSDPDGIYEASGNSYCLANNHCCWEWKLKQNCPADKECKRPEPPEPKTQDRWCVEPTGADCEDDVCSHLPGKLEDVIKGELESYADEKCGEWCGVIPGCKTLCVSTAKTIVINPLMALIPNDVKNLDLQAECRTKIKDVATDRATCETEIGKLENIIKTIPEVNPDTNPICQLEVSGHSAKPFCEKYMGIRTWLLGELSTAKGKCTCFPT